MTQLQEPPYEVVDYLLDSGMEAYSSQVWDMFHHIEDLEAKVVRLESRGITDMQHRIKELEEELEGRPVEVAQVHQMGARPLTLQGAV